MKRDSLKEEANEKIGKNARKRIKWKEQIVIVVSGW